MGAAKDKSHSPIREWVALGSKMAVEELRVAGDAGSGGQGHTI